MPNRENQQRIGGVLVLGSLAILVSFMATQVMATHTVTKTEDIRNTKHYFIGNPDILADDSDTGPGTSEVCIFCHTPHGANPNVTEQAPIWNRNIPIDTTFDVYKAPNFEGAGVFPGRPKGVSLACLSCHDGTIAIDAIINAAGSGGFIAENQVAGAPGVSSPMIGFSGGGVDGASSMKEGDRDDTEGSTTIFSPFSGGLHDIVFDSGGSDVGMEPFPNLGSNLSDDHPVGMEIPADGFSPGAIRDPQFAPIGANSPPPVNDGASIKFITRSAGIYPTDIRDRIRAYPSTLQAGEYYVECATCHNPHTPRVNFLRMPSFVPRLVLTSLDPSTPIDDPGGLYDTEPWGQYPNNQSAICLTCHAK